MKHSSQAHSHSKKVESKTPLVIIGVFVLAVGAAAIIYFANSRTLDNNDTSSLAAFNKTKMVPADVPVSNDVPDTAFADNPETTNQLEYGMPTDALEAKVVYKYKNGSYKNTINYDVPRGGSTSNLFTIRFSKDKISSASVKITAKGESKTHQTNFRKALPKYLKSIKTKSIDSVTFTKIGGATLTSQAFFNALTKSKAAGLNNTVTPTPKPSTVTTKYKNGSYTATVNYRTPGGQESNSVTFTLKDDKVDSTDFSIQSNNATSRNYQQGFKNSYKSSVVGKSLDSVSINVIARASLTSHAFMDAVNQIKSQAKS